MLEDDVTQTRRAAAKQAASAAQTAIGALLDIVEDPDTPASPRVNAARALLQTAGLIGTGSEEVRRPERMRTIGEMTKEEIQERMETLRRRIEKGPAAVE
ncbi:hypothetical protein NOR53_1265 [gamma proteobacterium NOR5-3]|nr:hypothetical protein NOR53_1265 [gamma proteobacterium NOR5-3]